MSFDALFKFEQDLAAYTGAPYAVVTDGCTHAIELCLRYDQVKSCEFTPYTYISVPMLMHHLGIDYRHSDYDQQEWTGEYPFIGTRIWDSARKLEHNMYRPGQLQCLSFGWTKPLQLGKVGAVLTDDPAVFETLSRWRSDGRNLHYPWDEQTEFDLGFHYCPTLELCVKGSELLPTIAPQTQQVFYPDCRKIKIKS